MTSTKMSDYEIVTTLRSNGNVNNPSMFAEFPINSRPLFRHKNTRDVLDTYTASIFNHSINISLLAYGNLKMYCLFKERLVSLNPVTAVLITSLRLFEYSTLSLDSRDGLDAH